MDSENRRGMFDNFPYEEGYIPDNTVQCIPPCPIHTDKLPRELYNIDGKFIGYTWSHGDTLSIHYELDMTILPKVLGSTIKVTVLDHNRLAVHSYSTPGAFAIDIPIDKELSNTMIDGNYFITVEVDGEDFAYVSREICVTVGGT